MNSIGNRIKYLRIKNRITQKQLSERIGVSKSLISSYETTLRQPSIIILSKLAVEFKVTTDYLIGLMPYDPLNVSGLTDVQLNLIKKLISEFNNRGNIETSTN